WFIDLEEEKVVPVNDEVASHNWIFSRRLPRDLDKMFFDGYKKHAPEGISQELEFISSFWGVDGLEEIGKDDFEKSNCEFFKIAESLGLTRAYFYEVYLDAL